MIEAQIVGSLPKPSWLQERAALNAPGKDVHGRGAEWLVPTDYRHAAQDDAVRLAIRAQERAGMNVVTDGEQRRTGYLRHVVERLQGIDYAELRLKWTQNRRRQAEVGRCVGPVSRQAPLVLDDATFALAQTDLPLKVTLPGPLTIVEATSDEHYRDEPSYAFALAEALNAEAAALFAAGVSVVQFDEPIFARRVPAVREWGLAALDVALAGLGGVTAVHVCYSYPMPGVPRPINDSYPELIDLLNRSPVRQLSLEFKEADLPLTLLERVEGKDVLLGCVSNATERVETADEVAAMLERAARALSGGRLVASTDCGLLTLTPEVAAAKMRALALGRDLVNGRADEREQVA